MSYGISVQSKSENIHNYVLFWYKAKFGNSRTLHQGKSVTLITHGHYIWTNSWECSIRKLYHLDLENWTKTWVPYYSSFLTNIMTGQNGVKPDSLCTSFIRYGYKYLTESRLINDNISNAIISQNKQDPVRLSVMSCQMMSPSSWLPYSFCLSAFHFYYYYCVTICHCTQNIFKNDLYNNNKSKYLFSPPLWTTLAQCDFF